MKPLLRFVLPSLFLLLGPSLVLAQHHRRFDTTDWHPDTTAIHRLDSLLHLHHFGDTGFFHDTIRFDTTHLGDTNDFRDTLHFGDTVHFHDTIGIGGRLGDTSFIHRLDSIINAHRRDTNIHFPDTNIHFPDTGFHFHDSLGGGFGDHDTIGVPDTMFRHRLDSIIQLHRHRDTLIHFPDTNSRFWHPDTSTIRMELDSILNRLRNNGTLDSIINLFRHWHGSIGGTNLNGGGSTLSIMPIVPNPLTMGGSATLQLTITAAETVNAGVYNQSGNLVLQLSNGPLTAGTYSFTIASPQLTTGIYIVRVHAGNDVRSEMLMVQ